MITYKRLLYPLVALILVVVGCQDSASPVDATSQAAAPQQGIVSDPAAKVVPGQYIVTLNDDVSADAVGKIAAQTIGFGKVAPSAMFTSAIKGFVAQISEGDVQKLRADPRVKYVEPDYRISVGTGNVVYNTSGTQVVPWGIQKVGGARDGTGKVAWIVDTGIDLYNADLNVDLTRSRNFVADGHTNAQDGNGHGTHVAGTIGARNNSFGVVGVAPNATLVAVRVLDNNGSGTYSAIISGLDYVTRNGHAGDVINMSLGGPASSSLDDAVRRAAYAGIKVAVAAGNSAVNASNTSPARVNYMNVYTVSAIDQNNYFASFSNYGNPPVDVAAPGVSVLSTYLGGQMAYMSGTSMATPHVAGLLLFGTIHGNGYARNDPDGIADPIAYQ
jgi:subtilisin family serine protease